MLVWRYVFLLVVLTILVLSTLACSIILANKGCFDIGLGKDGLAIHFDPKCSPYKD